MLVNYRSVISIFLLKLETKSHNCARPRSGKKEFHISRNARVKYQFDESLFSISGNVIIPNFRGAREFAQKMNDRRNVVNFPEKVVRTGQINAMGLIDEILHYVVQLYREQEKTGIMKDALQWLEKKIGKERLDDSLKRFIEEFPPLEVHRGKTSVEDYLQGEQEGIPNREVALEEMLLLWLANMNPAFSPFAELFDDTSLTKKTAYKDIFDNFPEFFDAQPLFGPEKENLIAMLRSPAIAEPHSLTGQLEYIRKKWGLLLGKYFYRLLSSLDLIKEEEKDRFFAPGMAPVYEFGKPGDEPERFSPDKEWMPKTVLLAKSAYVWLDQLSRKYQRGISRLDQIPDEELDQLAGWGFTGLWLIGLWERSKASQRIKQLCGNPEAVASAYSLMDYRIANDLGGEEAYRNLKERAWRRGIRMAGDMVPNHTGIDSNWVMEHPDWFLSLDYSPYPSYSFNGDNLSWNDGVGIFVEDHYYSRTDAAVVFKRVDFHNGNTRYIYHGNDGTSMPWNDTAQLNYLNPEVREAVIQTILGVARRFPIIRFDAAMTLAKKHFQRLWFPEPGTGGDIPSRAEHALTRSQFDQNMPEEFWREVVDRIAKEVPDTLLLAEAFWLMEGYFVRTLGMHRVYNSAFMNMLKKEENANYRSSIKNVLEFNPEILKRFVNFMNNPDEATAIAQFGRDDKYFGVCAMMVTMPGLPMFGHGQIEGFTEKYGMEYKKAYWDEQIDWDLVHRHEREIFPLMRKRYLFAEVDNFLLYDFFAPEGYVNENVFAWSNRHGDEKGLVVYNNKFEHAKGWVRTSVGFLGKTGDGGRAMQQKNLGEGLALHYDDNYYIIFRDHISGLEFIRQSKDMFNNGLYVELGAFKYQVFLDFREVEDNVWHHYGNLHAYLNGRGVPSIEEALRETFLQPIRNAFRELASADMFNKLYAARLVKPANKLDSELLEAYEEKIVDVLNEIRDFTQGGGDVSAAAKRIRARTEAILLLPRLQTKINCQPAESFKKIFDLLNKKILSKKENWFALFAWSAVSYLGAVVEPKFAEEQSRSGIDEWLLGKLLLATLSDLQVSSENANRMLMLVKILTANQSWWKPKVESKSSDFELLQNLLKDTDVQNWLQINRYRDVLWFNHEQFQALMNWLFIVSVIETADMRWEKQGAACEEIGKRFKTIRKFQGAEKKSEYQVSKLLEEVKQGKS